MPVKYWDQEGDDIALEAGQDMQKLLQDPHDAYASGEENLHIYINYHNGRETTEALYGGTMRRASAG
jgi:hypothetical protein